MTCPHCNKPLTEAQIKRIWASYTGSKQTPHAGPGRPSKPTLCPKCGKECASARVALAHCSGLTAEEAGKRWHANVTRA